MLLTSDVREARYSLLVLATAFAGPTFRPSSMISDLGINLLFDDVSLGCESKILNVNRQLTAAPPPEGY